jgi:hypothetical protein
MVRMAEEARLEESESGLEPVAERWFVVNVRDAAWMAYASFPTWKLSRPDDGARIALGLTV